MHQEQSGFGDNAVATLQANASIPEGMGIDGQYHVVCHDAQGNLKWEDEFPNLVVAVVLDKAKPPPSFKPSPAFE